MRGPITSLVGIGIVFISVHLGSDAAAVTGVILMGVGIGIWLEHDPK